MGIINTTKDSGIIQSLVIDEQVDDLAGSAQPMIDYPLLLKLVSVVVLIWSSCYTTRARNYNNMLKEKKTNSSSIFINFNQTVFVISDCYFSCISNNIFKFI